MRSPVKITRHDCGPFWGNIVIEARWCVHNSMIVHNYEIVALKTVMAEVVKKAIRQYERDAVELFGRYEQSDEDLQTKTNLMELVK